MKFYSAAVLLAGLSSLVAAVPQKRASTYSYPAQSPPSSVSSGSYARPTYSVPVCLTNTTATNLVTGFASLLTAYKKSTADALLSSDFTDTSDSINILAGYPLGSTTFPSKAAFEAGQGSQPAIGFNVDSIDMFTCDKIAFRWTASVGGTKKVKGIDLFYASNLNNTDQGWQIKTVYSEFNSAAWEYDIAGSCGYIQ